MIDADARAASQRQLMELIELDYDTTRSLIDGVVRTSLALRGVGLTLSLALLTFSVQQSSLPIAICGLAAVVLFLYLDAYHGWLYAEGLKRAHELERLLSLRYKALERADDDPDIAFNLDVALATHRFGQYSNIPRFKLRMLGKARPKSVYLVLYGILGGLSAAAIVYCAIT
jgi:hypothetical protein